MKFNILKITYRDKKVMQNKIRAH